MINTLVFFRREVSRSTHKGHKVLSIYHYQQMLCVQKTTKLLIMSCFKI